MDTTHLTDEEVQKHLHIEEFDWSDEAEELEHLEASRRTSIDSTHPTDEEIRKHLQVEEFDWSDEAEELEQLEASRKLSTSSKDGTTLGTPVSLTEAVLNTRWAPYQAYLDNTRIPPNLVADSEPNHIPARLGALDLATRNIENIYTTDEFLETWHSTAFIRSINIELRSSNIETWRAFFAQENEITEPAIEDCINLPESAQDDDSEPVSSTNESSSVASTNEIPQLSNEEQYLDHNEDGGVDESEYHHVNFNGEPTYYRSTTPPEVSLWATFTFTTHPDYEKLCWRRVLVLEASKYLDPFHYRGPQGLLELQGTELCDSVTAYVDKVYSPYGTWMEDILELREGAPSLTTDVSFYNFECQDSQALSQYWPSIEFEDVSCINDDGRAHPPGKNTDRSRSWFPRTSKLNIMQNVNDFEQDASADVSEKSASEVAIDVGKRETEGSSLPSFEDERSMPCRPCSRLAKRASLESIPESLASDVSLGVHYESADEASVVQENESNARSYASRPSSQLVRRNSLESISETLESDDLEASNELADATCKGQEDEIYEDDIEPLRVKGSRSHSVHPGQIRSAPLSDTSDNLNHSNNRQNGYEDYSKAGTPDGLGFPCRNTSPRYEDFDDQEARLQETDTFSEPQSPEFEDCEPADLSDVCQRVTACNLDEGTKNTGPPTADLLGDRDSQETAGFIVDSERRTTTRPFLSEDEEAIANSVLGAGCGLVDRVGAKAHDHNLSKFTTSADEGQPDCEAEDDGFDWNSLDVDDEILDYPGQTTAEHSDQNETDASSVSQDDLLANYNQHLIDEEALNTPSATEHKTIYIRLPCTNFTFECKSSLPIQPSSTSTPNDVPYTRYRQIHSGVPEDLGDLTSNPPSGQSDPKQVKRIKSPKPQHIHGEVDDMKGKSKSEPSRAERRSEERRLQKAKLKASKVDSEIGKAPLKSDREATFQILRNGAQLNPTKKGKKRVSARNSTATKGSSRNDAEDQRRLNKVVDEPTKFNGEGVSELSKTSFSTYRGLAEDSGRLRALDVPEPKESDVVVQVNSVKQNDNQEHQSCTEVPTTSETSRHIGHESVTEDVRSHAKNPDLHAANGQATQHEIRQTTSTTDEEHLDIPPLDVIMDLTDLNCSTPTTTECTCENTVKKTIEDDISEDEAMSVSMLESSGSVDPIEILQIMDADLSLVSVGNGSQYAIQDEIKEIENGAPSVDSKNKSSRAEELSSPTTSGSETELSDPSTLQGHTAVSSLSSTIESIDPTFVPSPIDDDSPSSIPLPDSDDITIYTIEFSVPSLISQMRLKSTSTTAISMAESFGTFEFEHAPEINTNSPFDQYHDLNKIPDRPHFAEFFFGGFFTSIGRKALKLSKQWTKAS
ncbi:hypothetical protein MMC09_000673 [Bachmanniomyces sp. S44760]|nr:hypothetical protein [Bachmanniomyces sp. S44760]